MEKRGDDGESRLVEGKSRKRGKRVGIPGFRDRSSLNSSAYHGIVVPRGRAAYINNRTLVFAYPTGRFCHACLDDYLKAAMLADAACHTR